MPPAALDRIERLDSALLQLGRRDAMRRIQRNAYADRNFCYERPLTCKLQPFHYLVLPRCAAAMGVKT